MYIYIYIHRYTHTLIYIYIYIIDIAPQEVHGGDRIKSLKRTEIKKKKKKENTQIVMILKSGRLRKFMEEIACEVTPSESDAFRRPGK